MISSLIFKAVSKFIFVFIFCTPILSGARPVRKKNYIMPYYKLMALSRPNRVRYLKAVGKELTKFPDFNKRLKKVSFLKRLSLFNFAYADSTGFRCIGGGVAIRGGEGANCGVSSYAGFDCPEGMEICNPLIFGLKPNNEPVCYDDAITSKCYNDIVMGTTTIISDEMLRSPEVRRAYEAFYDDFNAVCGGRVPVHEPLSSRREACTLLSQQMRANIVRGFSFDTPPTEGEAELAGSNEVEHGVSAEAEKSCEQRYTEKAVRMDISYFAKEGSIDCGAVDEFLSLLDKFSQPRLQGSRRALERALAFYVKHKHQIEPCDGDVGAREFRDTSHNAVTGFNGSKFILMADFTVPHPAHRFFIMNVETGEVKSCPVAHGVGSNTGCAEGDEVECKREVNGVEVTEYRCRRPATLSNTPNSNQTSRGFFQIGKGYTSSSSSFTAGELPSVGINALFIRGLIGGVNSNALSRSVVFHRAAYSSDRCGNSHGCPAICPDLFERYKLQVEGSLLYLHTAEDEVRAVPDC